MLRAVATSLFALPSGREVVGSLPAACKQVIGIYGDFLLENTDIVLSQDAAYFKTKSQVFGDGSIDSIQLPHLSETRSGQPTFWFGTRIAGGSICTWENSEKCFSLSQSKHINGSNYGSAPSRAEWLTNGLAPPFESGDGLSSHKHFG